VVEPEPPVSPSSTPRAAVAEAGLLRDPLFTFLFPLGPKQLRPRWPADRCVVLRDRRSRWRPPTRRLARS
jgi:hypothetical protein